MASVKTISPERDREKEQTAFQQLVRKPKYEPDVVLDWNAATFKKRRAVAPLANRSHGRRHERFRTTYRLDALNVSVRANHSVQSYCAFNPLLFGFDRIKR
jgi:hypothetical protein